MKPVIAMSLKSVGTDVLLMDETHSFIEIIAEILDRAVPSFLIIDRDGRILKLETGDRLTQPGSDESFPPF